MTKNSYNVVFKTLTGTSEGVITRSTFESKDGFEKWYGQTMKDGSDRPIKDVYAVVAQGVTDAEASRIIASPESTNAVLRSLLREEVQTLNRVSQSLASLGL